jgi:DNA-binding CsgD family transcriptional regulator
MSFIDLTNAQELLHIFNSLETPIYINDVSVGGVVFANNACFKMIGMAPMDVRELQPFHFFERIHPDDMAAIFTATQHLQVAPELALPFTYRIKSMDEDTWIQVKGYGKVLKLDESGKMAQILCVCFPDYTSTKSIDTAFVENYTSEKQLIYQKLSKREKHILMMVIMEHTTPEIALRTKLSPFTIDTHRKNIMRKTGSRNLVGLIRFAVEAGLI